MEKTGLTERSYVSEDSQWHTQDTIQMDMVNLTEEEISGIGVSYYLNGKVYGTPDIKIITGIRRSGKSKLIQAYIEYLKSHFENINIISIDFMDLAYEEIKEYHAMHSYAEKHYQEGKTNYLLVDEVQMCPKFELAINSLYSKGKYDIYVIGSNAFLLRSFL